MLPVLDRYTNDPKNLTCCPTANEQMQFIPLTGGSSTSSTYDSPQKYARFYSVSYWLLVFFVLAFLALVGVNIWYIWDFNHIQSDQSHRLDLVEATAKNLTAIAAGA